MGLKFAAYVIDFVHNAMAGCQNSANALFLCGGALFTVVFLNQEFIRILHYLVIYLLHIYHHQSIKTSMFLNKKKINFVATLVRNSQ